MNKFLQTSLLAVVVATSCFASGDISGDFNVFGNFDNMHDTKVSALLHIGSGGTYHADNTTFLAGGGLIIDNEDELGNTQDTVGKFYNNGTMDLTQATGNSFSGPIIGGTIKLSDQTTGDFTNLEIGKESTTTVIYEASGTETLSIKLDDNVIVKNRETTGSVDVSSETIKEKFNIPDGNDVEIDLTNVTCTTTDNRPDSLYSLINDGIFNASGVKMDTDTITEITKAEGADFSLGDNDTNIKLSLTGSSNINFNGSSETALTFSGNNSEYTGTSNIELGTVVADGNNALPANVVAMPIEKLEIKSGSNKIASGSSIHLMREFIIKSGASFTISSGARLNTGS